MERYVVRDRHHCQEDPKIRKYYILVNSTTLTYDITARGCEYGMGEVNGTCTFGSGSGTCYCNGDKCNDQPAGKENIPRGM